MVTFILFIPTLVHLVMDSIQIVIKKKFVNHLGSGFVTAVVGVPCGTIYYFAEGSHWFQPFLAMLCFHFALFSLLLNIVRMIAKSLPRRWESLFYLNSPSDGEQNWWDKQLYGYPWYGLLLFWFIIGLVGYCIVFMWECILHGQSSCPWLYAS